MKFMAIVLVLQVNYVSSYKEASRLYDVLMNQQHYNKIVRPVRNFSEALTVFFGLGLLQLMDVDEVNQVITSNVLVSLEWTDIKLTWRPEDFGGVTNLFIPSELLWLPDLMLYNNADGNYVVDIMTKATVFHNGTVRWTPPAIFKSSCHINVEYFPYDIQECTMKFGTWSNNGDQGKLRWHGIFQQFAQRLLSLRRPVNLKHMTQKHVPDHDGNVHIDYAMNLKDFYPSTEFELLRISAIRRSQFYPCCAEPFLDVTFNISMRRKTLFYTINLIVPCVGIAFLTILVFYLPSQSGGKISLSINILLSLTVFLLLLTESIPPTGLVIPLIGKYLLFTMILVTLSILKTIFVLNLSNRTPNSPVPLLFRQNSRVTQLLRFIGLEPPQTPRRDSIYQTTAILSAAFGEAHPITVPPDALNSSASSLTNSAWTSSKARLFDLSGRKPSTLRANLTTNLRILCFIRNLHILAEHLSELQRRKSAQDDWIYLSMVFDRLFLCFFVAVCLTGALTIIFQAPALYDTTEALTSANIPEFIHLTLQSATNNSNIEIKLETV